MVSIFLLIQKGVTVSVKMGPVIDTGHDMKLFDGFYNLNAFLTYGFDGTLILRQPDAPEDYGESIFLLFNLIKQYRMAGFNRPRFWFHLYYY